MTHERFKEIAFFLQFFPYEKKELPEDSKPLENWLKGQTLSEIEILYLVGLFHYPLPETITQWLAERKERALVILDDDLGAFASFTQLEILDNPQIHLHYAKDDPIEELACLFPCDRLAIFEGKPFDAEQLQRRSAALSALYSDVLYSHKIVENVLANYQRLHTCFNANALKFKNIPAIICGAGPSLEKSFSALRTEGNKGLIFAGGSAIPILTRNNIRPHFAIALDPNHEEFERLQQHAPHPSPFLFAPRVHRDVFSTMSGPYGYLKTDTGGYFESWLEEKLGLDGNLAGPDMGSEAFSVTTLAISYAYALGCNPIILTGVDLAYTSGKRYASGVEADKGSASDPRALEKVLMRSDIHGNPVETLLKWVMESDCISAFAKNHPETTFLNASEGGMGFDGIENIPLEQALSPLKTHDIDHLVQKQIEANPLDFDPEKLTSLIQELETSLERCETLCENRTIVDLMDLEEEPAYLALLQGIAAALDRVLVRYFPHLDPEEGKKIRDNAKYQELKLQIAKFKRIIGEKCLSAP